MAKEMLYTAIDIGTSKVCSIVARVGAEGELKVLGTGVTPSRGMQKGCIENIDEVKEAVRESTTEAQRYAGKGGNLGAYVVVGGAHISSLNTNEVMQHAGDPDSITTAQMHQFIQSSLPPMDGSQEVLHIIPIGYRVDGLSGVRNPAGLYASQVQLEAHVALGNANVLKNTVKAVESNRIPVNSLVLQSFASAEATLTADEREIGVILVDIGCGTTDITLFLNGGPRYSAVIPVGGSQLTRDLAVSERIPYHLAEEIKIKWGNVVPELVGAEEEVVIPGQPGQPNKLVNRQDLCEPLSMRMLEILKIIMLRVSQAGLRQLPPGGLVFTGGSAEMTGLRELTEETLGGPVRIAHPEGIAGLPTQLRKPGFSAGVGTLLWGIKHQGERRSYRSPEGNSIWGYKSLLNKFGRSRERVSR